MVINPIVGVYIPIIRIPIKGGMTIPNIATFDHDTHGETGVDFFQIVRLYPKEFSWFFGGLSWIRVKG